MRRLLIASMIAAGGAAFAACGGGSSNAACVSAMKAEWNTASQSSPGKEPSACKGLSGAQLMKDYRVVMKGIWK